jgi:hypothetical protein
VAAEGYAEFVGKVAVQGHQISVVELHRQRRIAGNLVAGDVEVFQNAQVVGFNGSRRTEGSVAWDGSWSAWVDPGEWTFTASLPDGSRGSATINVVAGVGNLLLNIGLDSP